MGDSRRVELVPDGTGGVTVAVDGTLQSYVDLDDPGLLVFEYVQHLAALLDTLPAGRLAVTHVGGAGMTLPRYVQVTRPGSPQIVLEPDDALTARVRRELPLPRGHRIRVRAVDGKAGLAALLEASADVVVLDAFAGGRMPAELGTVEFVADVARVLRPDGLLLANLADEPRLRYAARVVAGIVALLPEAALLAATEVVKGRRFGNVVVAASRAPLPLDDLRRRVAGLPFPTTLLTGPALGRRIGTARPFSAADAMPSPEPPADRTWRLR